MSSRGEEGGVGTLVVEPLGDGGISHYSFNLVNALLDAGYQTQLCTASRYEFKDKDWPPGSLRTSLFRVAFLLIRIFPGIDVEHGGLAKFRRLIKLLEYPFNCLESVLVARFRGLRIMHLQTVNSVDLLMVVAARMMGMRVVVTVHNVNPLHGEMTGVHRRLLQWMYDLSDRLIIHTASGRDEIMDLFGVPMDKVQVIPHGDYSFFLSEDGGDEESTLVPRDGNELLFFGAVRPNKGLDVLLKAMPAILRDHPECRLRVVGEPVGGFDPYRRIIEDLGLEKSIDEVLHYVGNDEVAGYFQSAAVAVLPYREITQSGVIQVAFACSTPIVASDLPGFREVIDSGVHGLLVEAENADALGKACSTLLADAELARQMGGAARERMEKEFSWVSIARRTYSEVYHPTA